MPDSSKRFRVAFSFAGEQRAFVAQVAALLAAQFGEAAILYDKYHEAEFARRDLGFHLPDLYHDQSDLIVVVVSPNYEPKEWCGLEWDATFDLLKQRQNDAVMLCRFEHATVKGLYSTAGFVELDHKTPAETATLILQRLAINDSQPRDHYLTEIPGVSSDAPRGRKPMRLVSTHETIDRGEITLLAIVETVLAVLVLIGLSVWFDSVKWLAGACALAPLLLLRTEDSDQRAVRWGKGTESAKFTKMRSILQICCVLGELWLCVWMLGWWTLLIVACLGGSLCTSLTAPLFLTIRFGATAVSMIKHPFRSLLAIPENWRRVVLATDSHTPPEFLPGERISPVSIPELWNNDIGVAPKWFFATMILGLYPPASAYRWSVKATCLIYLPLVWIVNRATFTTGSVRETLEDYLADDIQRVRRVLAAVAIVAVAFKITLLWHVDNAVAWVQTNAPAWVQTILHKWDHYIVPHQVPLWQIAPAVNGVLAIGLWLFGRRVLRLKDRAPAERTVLAVWRTMTTLSLALSLYTIVFVVLITWRAGNLLENLQHLWNLIGKQPLP